MSDFLRAVGNGALFGAGLSLMTNLSPWGNSGYNFGYGMGAYSMPLLMFGGGWYGGHCHHHCNHLFWC